MEFAVFFIAGLLGVGSGIGLKSIFVKKGHNRLLSIAGAWCAGFLIFAVSAALCLSFIGPDAGKPTTTEQKPEITQAMALAGDDYMQDIKGYSPEIIDVVDQGSGVLDIQMKASGPGFSKAGYITTLASQARDVLLKLLDKHPDAPVQLVRFIVIGNYTDQYNKPFQGRIFSIAYEYPQLKQLNRNTRISSLQLLNFAGFDFNRPEGFEMYKEWCGKGDNAEKAGSFCGEHSF